MRKLKGFTLVEVLVALVVLTVAFSALMVSLNETVRNVGFLKNETAANWVASNVMAQAQLGVLKLNSQTGKMNGEEVMLGKNYTWQLKVSSTENEKVNQLDVEVSEENKKGVILSLVGYMRGGDEN